jgi:hypothetical protein
MIFIPKSKLDETIQNIKVLKANALDMVKELETTYLGRSSRVPTGQWRQNVVKWQENNKDKEKIK